MVNGLAVWDRARHEARLELAAAAFAPDQALLGYRDTDEGRSQKARLAVIPRPRVVVFGSSRAMTISMAMVGAGPGEFYNIGLSGGTVEDFIVMWSTSRFAGNGTGPSECSRRQSRRDQSARSNVRARVAS
jgi:hypothetical protein